MVKFNLQYNRQILLLPDNQSSCSTGELAADSFYFKNLAKNRLYLKLASSSADFSPSTNDYVTVAFYNDGGKSGMSGPHLLSLAAVDKTKYHFQEDLPPYEHPITPPNIQLSFQPLDSAINIKWDNSSDPDTTDALVVYQINISTSSILEDDNWKSIAADALLAVSYPNRYTIGLRAVDDFGNASPAEIENWNFPDGFAPLPSQTDHSQKIIPSSGGGQRILITATTTLSQASMWLGSDSYRDSQVYLEIKKDDNGAFGETIASSSIVVLPGNESERKAIFTFAKPVDLTGGSYYWLVPEVVKGASGCIVFGGPDSSYPDGYWNNFYNTPGADAYFELKN